MACGEGERDGEYLVALGDLLCAAIAAESHRNALFTNAVLCFLYQLPFHCVGRMIPFACSESRVNSSDTVETISSEC